MSEVELARPVKARSKSGERIDHERREALTQLAKYTAPAMLAALITAKN
jgi:hypothetical protein